MEFPLLIFFALEIIKYAKKILGFDNPVINKVPICITNLFLKYIYKSRLDMLNKKLLRNELEIIAKKLKRKNFFLDKKNLKKKEQQRKLLQMKIIKLLSEKKSKNKIIGIYKSHGKEITSMFIEMNQLNLSIDNIKHQLNKVKEEINSYALIIPNIPDDDVPSGTSSKDNIEIFRWGKPKKYNFPVRDHVELGEMTGELDFNSATKLTGSRFIVMSGKMARMHRALSQFMLDLHTLYHGYKEYYLPYIVNYESLYGSGQLPKFKKDLFLINCKNNYALIPTAEVPLINLIRDKILEENVLPLKMTAYTPCFRLEAGSYGRDYRGLIRMHQFDKVEIVQVVKPYHSMQALEEITNHAEKVLQLLNLPYRKMLLCTGEMGFSSCKTYDLEVWQPSQKRYYEISSCSNISDFQARRINGRYRCKNSNKIDLLHTLNGSGLAVGRTLVALLENYQLEDGSIEIPEILQPYMKNY